MVAFLSRTFVLSGRSDAEVTFERLVMRFMTQFPQSLVEHSLELAGKEMFSLTALK